MFYLSPGPLSPQGLALRPWKWEWDTECSTVSLFPPLPQQLLEGHSLPMLWNLGCSGHCGSRCFCSMLNEARTVAQVTLVIQPSGTLSCVQNSSAGQEGLSLRSRATGQQECVLGRSLDSRGPHSPYTYPVELFLLLLGFIFYFIDLFILAVQQ